MKAFHSQSAETARVVSDQRPADLQRKPHSHQLDSYRCSLDGFSAGLGATDVQLSALDSALLQFREAVATRQSGDIHAIAARGVGGSGGSLPHKEAIQRSFGRHDVSGVVAHTGAKANDATSAMGAYAYATGDSVVLGDSGTDLHTVAHEAAHVIQQRGGVSLKGGVGQVGDRYEVHADAVADKVVAGESAESLLDEMTGGATATTTSVGTIQRVAHVRTLDHRDGSPSVEQKVVYPLVPTKKVFLIIANPPIVTTEAAAGLYMSLEFSLTSETAVKVSTDGTTLQPTNVSFNIRTALKFGGEAGPEGVNVFLDGWAQAKGAIKGKVEPDGTISKLVAPSIVGELNANVGAECLGQVVRLRLGQVPLFTFNDVDLLDLNIGGFNPASCLNEIRLMVDDVRGYAVQKGAEGLGALEDWMGGESSYAHSERMAGEIATLNQMHGDWAENKTMMWAPVAPYYETAVHNRFMNWFTSNDNRALCIEQQSKYLEGARAFGQWWRVHDKEVWEPLKGHSVDKLVAECRDQAFTDYVRSKPWELGTADHNRFPEPKVRPLNPYMATRNEEEKLKFVRACLDDPTQEL